MRILIADDDSIGLALLEEALMSSGHEVHCASDGNQALRVLDAECVSVLIADWQMPGLTGPDLCRRVRARNSDHYVYSILLTARNDRASLIEGLDAGADEFLTKPLDPDELRVRLRSAERLLGLETRDLTILAMAKLAESRDNETGTHLERVRQYCRILAQELSGWTAFAALVDQDFVRLIYATSPLHDIGKVGIPDSILKKAGKLDEAEFAIMKSHTTIGADCLGAAISKFPSTAFLRMARDIAATHHERWDGSGYPTGLRGEQIPLAGRVMALADTYDALRSKRVYKPSFPHEVVRGIIVAESGKQFDPDIVQAFVNVESQFVAWADELLREAA